MKSRNFWFTLYAILLIGLVFIFLTEINVENTKALSPIGISTEDNFQMVSSEFGKDFEELPFAAERCHQMSISQNIFAKNHHTCKTACSNKCPSERCAS